MSNYLRRIIFLLFVILSGLNLFALEKVLKIHFINVGEGDSIFIEFPDKKNALIDTGNLKTGVDVYNYLKQLKVKKINHLILTHPHPDHIGGVFTVAQLLEVDNFYDNGDSIEKVKSKEDLYRWYDDFFRKNIRYKELSVGDLLEFDGAKLEVLWPDKWVSEEWNANSLVIMLSYGSFKCLLMADGNNETESFLMKKDINLQADILKAGHHGAEDTADADFVNIIKPQAVIISVNENNVRGYPSPDVIKNYEAIDAMIYYIYSYKSIVLSVKKDGAFRLIERR